MTRIKWFAIELYRSLLWRVAAMSHAVMNRAESIALALPRRPLKRIVTDPLPSPVMFGDIVGSWIAKVAAEQDRN